MTIQTATFGAGCFWGVEYAFGQIDGVVDTAVGYMGGHTEAPTYREVCSKSTGHAEVCQVQFDPAVVSYDALLTAFWSMHDPTTKDRQGPDVGSQYRSVIFYHDEDQRTAAEASKMATDASGNFRGPIVTEISAAETFWRAEDYHQRYVEKTGRGCSVR